jgi:signal transduction histidine kinase
MNAETLGGASLHGEAGRGERPQAVTGQGQQAQPDPRTLLSSGPEGLELVAEIAHDLRSPLTSIITLAETLRSGLTGEVNEIQRRQLGLIYSAALALSSTASDVVELAHGGDSLAQSEPSPFSIREILESVGDIVRPMAEEKELELRFTSAGTDRRLGYPLALSRVLLNLTTNALKFTDKGFVEIAALPTGRTELEFSVRDSGRGINPRAMTTLYEPFRQEDRGYTFSGTGLGLTICRRLVEAMGSKLELETRLGWGTRFSFRLELPPASQFV